MLSRNKKFPMSQSFITAILITLSGGFQDAYTYFMRNEVFANAQTGNIVLMSTYVLRGDISNIIRYLIPLCAFATGVFIAETVHRNDNKTKNIHWRQIILSLEIILLFSVGFIPHEYDTAASSIVSFVCAMQVQAFRKIHGNGYASTMCIGNLRSGMDNLCTYIFTKDKSSLHKAVEYCAVIITFAIGAGLGSFISLHMGIKAIWLSCVLLFISDCLMFINRK